MKMKKFVAICCCLWMTLLFGCGDPEERATKTYNKAAAMERAGGVAEAEGFYRDILKKYPSTKTAEKVRKMLAEKAKAEEAVGK